MALDEINGTGGVLGRKIEVTSRDDNGNPGDTVRVAEELLSREGVSLLFGGSLSNTGLALTDYAKQRRIVFLAAEPLTDKIVWQNGNKYTFRLRPSTYMQVAMLVPEAARMKKKRWALVYPNYEYGQSAAATFKAMLKAAQPDVEFVTEQATTLGKIDAGSTVQALADAKPDAIFNALFATDLGRFVREGNTRGLFEGREVVSLLTGEPEYLDPLGDEAPINWLVTGYPWYAINTADNTRFVEAYRKRYNEPPRVGSVVGYAAMHSVAAIAKAFDGFRALDDVSFEVDAGQMVALIGPNGAGKSTCFNVLNGQLKPDAGSIVFGGGEIAGLAPRTIWRKGVARTFQVAASFVSLSAIENVQLALASRERELQRWWKPIAAMHREEALALLERVGMRAMGDQNCGQLAYGDVKRIELAIALASCPRLLLMDETTAGMSSVERASLMKLVKQLAAEQGVAALFTEHSVDAVFGFADRVIVMARGKVIAAGAPDAIRRDAKVGEVYLGAGSLLDELRHEAPR